MSTVTLSSDLGQNNAEVALYHAMVSQALPSQDVIPLIHIQDSYDLESIGYNLYYALQNFPDNTMHIILCKYAKGLEKIQWIHLKNQWVLTSDNGLISLIHELDYTSQVLEKSIDFNHFSLKNTIQNYIHSVQDIYNKQISTYQPNPIYTQLKPFNTDLIITPDYIFMRIIHINPLGNIVVNLNKREFESSISNRRFSIKIMDSTIDKISKNYLDTDTHSKLGALFNDSGFLEIFLLGGNLAELYNYNKYANNKIQMEIKNDQNSQINF